MLSIQARQQVSRAHVETVFGECRLENHGAVRGAAHAAEPASIKEIGIGGIGRQLDGAVEVLFRFGGAAEAGCSDTEVDLEGRVIRSKWERTLEIGECLSIIAARQKDQAIVHEAASVARALDGNVAPERFIRSPYGIPLVGSSCLG